MAPPPLVLTPLGCPLSQHPHQSWAWRYLDSPAQTDLLGGMPIFECAGLNDLATGVDAHRYKTIGQTRKR